MRSLRFVVSSVAFSWTLALLAGGAVPDAQAGVSRAGGASVTAGEAAWPTKLTPGLRGRALQPGERLDLLVQLRLPADLDAHVPADLGAAPRLRFIRETGDELAREYRPFGGEVVERFRFLPVVHMTIAAEMLEALAGDARVVSIEPMRVFTIQRQNGKTLMNVGPVASQGYDGTGISVAVLDTGVDYRHPELAPGGTDASAKTIKLWDTVDDDDDPMDANGHGTSVAAIVAGSVDGVAPRARIVAVRVLNVEGSSQSGSVLKGIDKVVESVVGGNPHNIRAVNLSLGGLDPDAWPPNAGNCDEELPSYKAAFDSLVNSGVLVLAAAGNDGCSTGVAYPACVSSAMAVGAVYNTYRPSRSWTTTCADGGCEDAPAPVKQIACYSNSGDKLAVWAPADCTPDCGLSARRPDPAGDDVLLQRHVRCHALHGGRGGAPGGSPTGGLAARHPGCPHQHRRGHHGRSQRHHPQPRERPGGATAHAGWVLGSGGAGGPRLEPRGALREPGLHGLLERR